MSIAKQAKLREYNTDILSHDTGASSNGYDTRVRNNATFQSNIMPVDNGSTIQQKSQKMRDIIFKERPLHSQVTRASYQDSNIFGYKNEDCPTIQSTAQGEEAAGRTRYNPTFSSRVFDRNEGNDDTHRPPSSSRQEDKWQSEIFEGPTQDQVRRKKLGQADSGTDKIFGSDKVDLDNRSNNMPVLGSKRETKQWKPVRHQKTAEQRKMEELHGRSAAVYGTGSKKDGSLMANNADWRNLQQTHTNAAAQKNGDQGATQNSRSMKFENLQSNIFGIEGKESQPAYDPNVEKAGFGTDANWTTQAASAKIINKGYKQDPYKKKQAQLSSQVFDQTDYSEYQPMNKPKLDVNNLKDKHRQNDHLYSDILGAEPALGNSSSKKNVGLKSNEVSASSNWAQQDVRSQVVKDYTGYSTKDQKHSQLRSALDTHEYVASPVRQTEQPDNSTQVIIPGKSTMATKIKDLSSDVLGTGNTINHYNAADRQTLIVDLDVRGLPSHTQAEDLKKISGAKHVISATVDQDAITNNCVGNGRIKLRLGGEDEAENVKLQFLKAGYGVQDHTDDSRLKPNFTQDSKSPARKEIDSKAQKLSNLQTNNPEMFGNTGKIQDEYNLNFDGKQIGKATVEAQVETNALNQWAQVGGRR